MVCYGIHMLLFLYVFLIALAIYQLWLRQFMHQFRTLLKGIIRMGEGELEPVASTSFSIGEFETMQQEIDRTSLALNNQMDTIRRMEREQAEQEHMLKEQERIAEELRTARELQRSALPMIFPPFPGRAEFDLYASMTPAREVGGDFYDFFLTDDRHLCIMIADVSGKGIPAALFMMASKITLSHNTKMGFSPAQILEKANASICSRNPEEMFITVWLGILDLETGVLPAANAGHEYPFLMQPGGEFELIRDQHGFVLGGMSGAKYPEYTLQMKPAAKLFLYTDGLPEATDSSERMFGTDRILTELNRNRDAFPKEILENMQHTVAAFVQDAEPFDDLTMLCLTFRGPEGV